MTFEEEVMYETIGQKNVLVKEQGQATKIN